MAKNLIGAGIVAAIVALGAVFAFTPSATAPKAGALAGPDIPFNYLRVGGLAQYSFEVPMVSTASTTLCAVPITATSSLLDAAISITVGSSTTALLDLATSTSQYATTSATTLLKAQATTASAMNYFSFDPVNNNNILSPGQFLLLAVEGPGNGGFQYTGTCSGQLITP